MKEIYNTLTTNSSALEVLIVVLLIVYVGMCILLVCAYLVYAYKDFKEIKNNPKRKRVKND